MSYSNLKLIKRWAEFQPIDEIHNIPGNTRGIYVLYNYRPRVEKFDVVYIGMASGLITGIKGRLKAHYRHKKKIWTHFSLYEVWDNITKDEVCELEGLFRNIYKRDSHVMEYNKQKTYNKLRKVKLNKLSAWNNIQ